MAVTAIPAAIESFLAAATTAVPTGTGVFDGIVRAGQSQTSLVVVTGWESEEREPATFGGAQFFTIEERFTLLGYIRCLEGSESQSVSRGQAFAVFEALETAVRDDPTLAGAVRVSWFSRLVGTQGAADAARGNGTQIDWGLFCEARI